MRIAQKWRDGRRSEGEKEEAKRGVRNKGKIRVVGALYLCLSPRKGLGSREGEERVSVLCVMVPRPETFLEHVS